MLRSDEAQARLSRCRPISGLQTARIEDGINHYAHNVGEVNFRRRAPLQLASTLGFVLNNRSGKFLGISDEERAALHECLTWLRQPGNNRLCFYGDELECFDQACRELMKRVSARINISLTLFALIETLKSNRSYRKAAHGREFVQLQGCRRDSRTGRSPKPWETRLAAWSC